MKIPDLPIFLESGGYPISSKYSTSVEGGKRVYYLRKAFIKGYFSTLSCEAAGIASVISEVGLSRVKHV